MFKQCVMAFAIIGLLSGSAIADTTNPKQTIKDNLGALRESLRDNQGFHADLATLGAAAGFAGIVHPYLSILFNLFNKPYDWAPRSWTPGYSDAQKLAFYVDAEKQLRWDCKLSAGLFIAGAIFAAYNAYQASELGKRADAIKNIDDAVEEAAI